MSRTVLIDALDAALAEVPAGRVVGVACSGGPDSFALGVLAAEVARRRLQKPCLFHVHHGLQPAADDWALQVEQLARCLDVAYVLRRVQVDLSGGEGLEAAARAVRYAALGDVAREQNAAVVLLGHHQDDQVETILLRLFRGTGLGGAAGMAPRTQRDGVVYQRPWLDVPRSMILPVATAEAERLGLALADDPTNTDTRYARGVLRREVLPAVGRHWPGYRASVVRFARLAADAQRILEQLAQEDLQRVSASNPAWMPVREAGRVLDRNRWLHLDDARKVLVLQAWLQRFGLAGLAEARLLEICHQLAEADPDRQVMLPLGEECLRVYRGHIVLVPSGQRASASRTHGRQRVAALPRVVRTWQGDPHWTMPDWDGVLYFEHAAEGIDPEWLAAQPLEVGPRLGGERMRVRAGGRSRTLKNLYQEAGIPAWQRARLPLVRRSNEVIYAAGLGVSADAPRSRPGISLRWTSGPSGGSDDAGGNGHNRPPGR